MSSFETQQKENCLKPSKLFSITFQQQFYFFSTFSFSLMKFSTQICPKLCCKVFFPERYKNLRWKLTLKYAHIVEKINCWQFGNFLHDRKLCDSNVSQIDGNLYSLELHLQAASNLKYFHPCFLIMHWTFFRIKTSFSYRIFQSFQLWVEF